MRQAAQSVERRTLKAEVRGSKPFLGTWLRGQISPNQLFPKGAAPHYSQVLTGWWPSIPRKVVNIVFKKKGLRLLWNYNLSVLSPCSVYSEFRPLTLSCVQTNRENIPISATVSWNCNYVNLNHYKKDKLTGLGSGNDVMVVVTRRGDSYVGTAYPCLFTCPSIVLSDDYSKSLGGCATCHT